MTTDQKVSPAIQTALSRTDELSSVQKQLARLKRPPKGQLLAKCEKVGLVGAELSRAVSLVLHHNSSLQHIVRWRQDGLSLDDIQHCLNIRDDYGFSMSVPLIKWYLEGARFRFPETGFEDVESVGFGAIGPEVIIDFFQEIAERIGGEFPHHRIMHFIEEHLGGDVMVAYDLGVESLEDLVGAIAPRYAHPLRLSAQDHMDIQIQVDRALERF